MLAANYKTAEQIVQFLVQETNSCLGNWTGKMSKQQQLTILGHYFGKGTIHIDGITETIDHIVKVSFGQDSAITKSMSFTGILISTDSIQEQELIGTIVNV